MRADNTAHLIAAARRRSTAARRAAINALRMLEKHGTPINFETVAQQAGVSRSWLYTQADLRAEIQRMRQRSQPTTPAIPDRQRASGESLKRRLQIATGRIRQLEADNQRLRDALATALGDSRAATRRDTPNE